MPVEQSKKKIWRLLERYGWSIPKTAIELGISYRTLYRWLHLWEMFEDVQEQKLQAITNRIKRK